MTNFQPTPTGHNTPAPPPLGGSCREGDVLPFLALAFGDETLVYESHLDQRGRRLLRRLEAAGEATLHRQEFVDEEGRSHVIFSYSLHPAPPPPRSTHLARAVDEFCDLYDRLPAAAWKHHATPVLLHA